MRLREDDLELQLSTVEQRGALMHFGLLWDTWNAVLGAITYHIAAAAEMCWASVKWSHDRKCLSAPPQRQNMQCMASSIDIVRATTRPG